MPQTATRAVTLQELVNNPFFHAGMADKQKNRAIPNIYDKLDKEQQNFYEIGRQLVALNPGLDIRSELDVSIAMMQADMGKDIL